MAASTVAATMVKVRVVEVRARLAASAVAATVVAAREVVIRKALKPLCDPLTVAVEAGTLEHATSIVICGCGVGSCVEQRLHHLERGCVRHG